MQSTAKSICSAARIQTSHTAVLCAPTFCGVNVFICRAPTARPLRSQLVANAVLLHRPQAAERSNTAASGKRLPVMGLISAAVDVQAQVQQFEVLAGRSAMIGFIVALVAELLTEHSIFRSIDAEQATVAAGIILSVLLLAAAAAASTTKDLGVGIKEAVITSLTAAQRSAASVTGAQVDRAVDNVLNKAFDLGTIYSLLADDDLL